MSAPLEATIVHDLPTLESVYGAPLAQACAKEVDYIHPHYRRFIELAPFCVLATCGREHVDASPRGDVAGFVRVADEKTLLLPDRRGNNRIDSLRNVLADGRVALLFLIPGIGETLRVKGRGAISTDASLCGSFAVDAKPPRSVLVVRVEAVYFQCARAVTRARLWDPLSHIQRSCLPSTGTILADLSRQRFGGEDFDRSLANRIKATLY